jgi:hypothetical protein
MNEMGWRARSLTVGIGGTDHGAGAHVVSQTLLFHVVECVFDDIELASKFVISDKKGAE